MHLSWSKNVELVLLSRLDQNPELNAALMKPSESSPAATPAGDDKSNLPKSRSTPRGAPIILVAVSPAAARIGLAMRVADSPAAARIGLIVRNAERPAAARIGPTDRAAAIMLVCSPVAAARIGLTPIRALITLRAANPAAAGPPTRV